MTANPTASIRVARVVSVTEAEGPGRRTALWVQGCSIRCHGCFNPHMWATTGGRVLPASELVEQAAASGVEGITLLGGEPFDQAESLGQLAAAVQVRGLSVMVFTGHTLRELRQLEQQSIPGVGKLLGSTDLLVDGPFLAHLVDRERPWIGSTNQRLHHLSGRYAGFTDCLPEVPDRLEVVVAGSGEVRVNGWAEPDALDRLLDGLGRRVDSPRSRFD